VAANPAFAAATPRTVSVAIASTETDLAVPTEAVLLWTAPANGSKIEEIDINAIATTLVATTVAGLVYLFIYNGSTYYLYDVYPVSAITASATTAGFRNSKQYPNLVLETGQYLYASQSESSNAGKLVVNASGADY
jgi:hypothetical protein